jgi:prephenate dehydrogenase
VLVVGAGLIGTSIGLALRARDVHVAITDTNPEHARTASALGAADLAEVTDPALVVVAVPPDHVATEIAAALRSTDACVTDVGSVKAVPLAAARRLVADKNVLSRYAGGHPMAGSERSGPLAASATLFDGRPWAVTPHPASSAEAVDVVHLLARSCGATPVRFTPEEHDLAVARTSHLPHLVAALVAGVLARAPGEHLALSGQGVRDVTRVAAGDPGLWQQILLGNGGALTDLLDEVRAGLDAVRDALATGDRATLAGVLDRGVAGTAAIPGKHGHPLPAQAVIVVAVPDRPGELARLFADVGDIGVNVEDMRIDHDPLREVGLAELSVVEKSADRLRTELEQRGWTVHR